MVSVESVLSSTVHEEANVDMDLMFEGAEKQNVTAGSLRASIGRRESFRLA